MGDVSEPRETTWSAAFVPVLAGAAAGVALGLLLPEDNTLSYVAVFCAVPAVYWAFSRHRRFR